MSSWSIVALAAVLCTAATFCWGLWLNAVYSGEYEEPEEEAQDTQVLWPKEGE